MTDRIVREIIAREMPNARILEKEELQAIRQSEGTIPNGYSPSVKVRKSVTAEQVIAKWANPEFIRNQYGEKEKLLGQEEPDIEIAVVETGRERKLRTTVIVDKKSGQIVGMSG